MLCVLELFFQTIKDKSINMNRDILLRDWAQCMCCSRWERVIFNITVQPQRGKSMIDLMLAVFSHKLTLANISTFSHNIPLTSKTQELFGHQTHKDTVSLNPVSLMWWYHWDRYIFSYNGYWWYVMGLVDQGLDIDECLYDWVMVVWCLV